MASRLKLLNHPAESHQPLGLHHKIVRSKSNLISPNPIRSTMSMTKSMFALPLSIVVLSVSSLLVTGQQPRTRAIPPPKSVPGGNPTSEQSEALSANYRITFSGKSDGKSLGELSTLTCARKTTISGTLNSSDTPTTFTVSALLEEKDGLLLFTYSIGFRVPITTMRPPQPGQPPSPSFQYQDHTSQGTLKMKPGKTYDLLKSGGNIYSIVVAPEEDK